MTENNGMVLKAWVTAMPWKMQSILFSGLRGPDFPNVPNVKKVSKWMRMVSQQNADPTKPYMEVDDLPEPIDVCEELEFLPCHYVHHLADALACVAYSIPDGQACRYAFSVYTCIAEELFHFIPEHPDIFEWRHRDKVNGLDSRPNPPFEDREWMDKFLPTGYIHR